MMWSSFTSRKPNLVDVLTGLRPGLVRDLATFAGADQRALTVIFSGMPWGDQATLAAYDALRLRRSSEGRVRVQSVAPWTVELVHLAADVTLGEHIIEELRPLQEEVRALEHTSADDAVQVVELRDDLPTATHIRSLADVLSIQPSSQLTPHHAAVRVLVQLSGSHPFSETRQFEIDVLSSFEHLNAARSLVLAWNSADHDLKRPDFVTLASDHHDAPQRDDDLPIPCVATSHAPESHPAP